MKTIPQKSDGKGEILRRLSFITDPVKRIQQMIEHGLLEEAWPDIDELINANRVYFQDASRRQQAASIGPVECEGKEKPSLICFVDLNACFTIEGLTATFGWDEERTHAFAVRIIRKVMTEIDTRDMRREIAGWAGSWEHNAFGKAMEKHLPESDELRPAAERWLLTGWMFDDGYMWGYIGGAAWLKWFKQPEPTNPGVFNRPDYVRHDMDTGIKKTDQWCQRMLALGASIEDVHELLISWLEKNGPHGLNPCFTVYVACCETLKSRKWRTREEGGGQVGNDRIHAALGQRLPEALEWMFEGRPLYAPEVFARLRSGGMRHTEERKMFLEWSAEILSRGVIGRVSVLWHRVGQSFDLQQPSQDSCSRQAVFDLSLIAAIAFDKAITSERMGVAAALVLQFGDEACFDHTLLLTRAKAEAKARRQRGYKQILDELCAERRTQIREAFEIARTIGQPIRLNYTARIDSFV